MSTVILEAGLMRHDRLNFHPLENIATTTIGRDDFLAFLRATGHEPRIVAAAGCLRSGHWNSTACFAP